MTDKNTALYVAAARQKSLGLGVVLALFFGGLGLLYASILGGLLMTFVEVVVGVIAVLTFGVGALLFLPLHVITIIWAIVAINSYNNKLLTAAARGEIRS